MNRLESVLGVVLVLCGAAAVRASDADWLSMPFTLHRMYQTVDASGAGTFPVTAPIRMRGIWLNRPQDMLDVTAGAAGFMGGQCQVLIQAVDDGDQGGTAAWMGQYIGKIKGTHPVGSYTNAEWVAEMARVCRDPGTGRRFRPGDLVEVRARAPGLFRAGKTNINEQHDMSPEQDFDLHLLQPAVGLPEATAITLANLKDAGDVFIFDATRTSGAELYQATVVRIIGVSFVSTANWRPGGQLVIQDSTGRTLPVLLGRSRGFATYPAPTGTFDIVGLFDQEDLNGADGWKQDYRLWAMGYNGSEFVIPVFPGDTDSDGDVDLADFGEFQGCFNGPNRPAAGNLCGDFDFDFDGDVDLVDFAEFQACFNGANMPPSCL